MPKFLSEEGHQQWLTGIRATWAAKKAAGIPHPLKGRPVPAMPLAHAALAEAYRKTKLLVMAPCLADVVNTPMTEQLKSLIRSVPPDIMENICNVQAKEQERKLNKLIGITSDSES